MKRILQSFNLFPQIRMWRINREAEVDNLAGGVISFLLIVVIFLILIFKMIEVFTYSTLTVTPQSLRGIEGRKGTITTNPQDNINQNIMIAMDFSNFPTGSYNAYGYYLGSTPSNITLEPCTISHFGSAISLQKYDLLNLPFYHCFPLNKQYSMQGSRLSSPYERMQLHFDCIDPIACQSPTQIGVLILSHFVDPYNKTNVWSPVIERYNQNFVPATVKQMQYNFIQNTVEQDRSIIPLQDNKIITTGYQFSPIIRVQSYTTLNSPTDPGFIFFIFSSPNYNNYSITYLTLLDAFSYMGGIMSVLISVFVFMTIYGKFFLQFFMAGLFFRSRAAFSFGFFSFFRQIIYISLSSVGYRPNWQLNAKRQKIRNTVLNMMSITFLQKRIQFLEKSLTIIFERHHLKGLHLLHSRSPRQADQCHKNYQLRQRVLLYFKLISQQQVQKEKSDKKKRSLSDIKDKIAPHQSASYLVNENIAQTKLKKLKEQEINRQRQRQADPDIMDEGQLIKIEQLGESEGFLVSAVEEQVKEDLRRLFQSASCNQPDERSRRILGMMDEDLYVKLERAIKQEQKQYRYDINA